MHDNLLDQTFSRFPHFSGEHIHVRPLEKGGSDRKFYRVAVSNHASLIVAKYGQQRDENRHYVSIARFLSGLGVRVPRIYFHDEEEGLIWMEDLGDQDLWSFRNSSWEVRRPLYRDALDQLLELHTHAHIAYDGESPKLQPPFTAELYRWEQHYFLENCLGRVFKLAPQLLEEECNCARLDEIAQRLAELPRVLIHRDFQSQNIVIKDEAACLIDFQGMRFGLAQYDLASLLQDPYVSLTEAERDELLRYYLGSLRELGQDAPSDFPETLDLCAMQRLMQALGAYGFLGLVKERTHFLTHIPCALKNLRSVVCRIPGLESLTAVLAQLDAAPFCNTSVR